MIFVWIALGVLVGLPVLVVVLGFFFPERYTGRTRVTFAKGVQEVWDALLDPRKHPMTGKMMRSIRDEPDENGLPVWVEDMGHGEEILVKTVESTPPARLVRTLSAKAVPMTSRWKYSLEGDAARTTVTVEGETFIRRGTWHVPIFRVMMVLGGGVKKGLDIQLRMIGRTLGVAAERG